jgi:hypothetical protein
VAAAAVAALVWGLSQGWADPPRAGPLLWHDDFGGGAARWELHAPAGGSLTPQASGLLAEFTAPDQSAYALTPGPAGDFTFELTGAQVEGEIGAAYGLIFGWQDETHYGAALVNGNGYAEAYRQSGPKRQRWFEWQQWPNILLGAAGNRVRVDVRGGQATVRINDEVLVAAEAGGAGKIGVLARGAGPGSVRFGWAQVWARP